MLASVTGLSAGWVLRGRPEAPVRADIVRYTLPLAESSELIDAPAISRDGSTVAWVALGADGRMGLWARVLSEGQDRLLTRDVAHFAFPFVSPSGEWVAYFTGRGLMKVATSGGAPIRIADSEGPQGGTWLDEETIVAVPYWADGLQLLDAGSEGEPRQLTIPKDGSHSHAWPVALPGSREVLFTVWGTSPTGAILSLETGDWRPIPE